MQIPQEVYDNPKTGTVILQFYVETDGSITDPVVVKSVTNSLDQEALRLVKAMPKWEPGMYKDTNVRVRYLLGIPFTYQAIYKINTDGFSFPGGNVAFMEWVKDNAWIPEYNMAGVKECAVFVRTKVRIDGTVYDPQIIEPFIPEFDNEALRLIGIMPKLERKLTTPVSGDAEYVFNFDFCSVPNDSYRRWRAAAGFSDDVFGLSKWLEKNICYPDEAKDSFLLGNVVVGCTVLEDGTVSDVSIVRSVHPSLDKEALRLVSSMPKWKNSKKVSNGEVSIGYTIRRPRGNYELKNETYCNLRWDISEKDSNKKMTSKHFVSVNFGYEEFNRDKAGEKSPEFEGGQKELNKWLIRNIDRTKIKEDGTVVVGVTIDDSGTLCNPKVLETTNSLLNQEALRLVGIMPKWKPAIRNGKNVKSNYCILVDFYDFDVKKILNKSVSPNDIIRSLNASNISNIKGICPKCIRQRGVNGNVGVRIVSDGKDKYTNVSITKHVDPILDRVALCLADSIVKAGARLIYIDDVCYETINFLPSLLEERWKYISSSPSFVNNAEQVNEGTKKTQNAIAVNKDEKNDQAARSIDELVKRGEVIKIKEAVPSPDGSNKKRFDVVDNMPSFPGGPQGLMEFLSNNVKYPVVAQEYGVQGRVIVSFVVETDGSLSDVKVEKPVDPCLDKEAIRVVKSMPKWIPGSHKGIPVRVLYNVPVAFRLQ